MEEIVAAGDYSVFESEAKRQHFIPRFHLKRFARERDGREPASLLKGRLAPQLR